MDRTDQVAEAINDWEHISTPDSESPPMLHQSVAEELQLSLENLHELKSSSSSSSSSPSCSSPSSSTLSPLSSNSGALRLRVEVIRARVRSTVRQLGISVTSFWLIFPVTRVVITVVVYSLYARLRQRFWRRKGGADQEKLDQLVSVIKVKDEKIGQLLLQIAQMNEILSAHHRVPVLE